MPYGINQDTLKLFPSVLHQHETIAATSNCGKRKLSGTIFDKTGRLLATASNTCSPPTQNVEWFTPRQVPDCPRARRDPSAGKAWELCRPIHCEIALILNALKGRSGHQAHVVNTKLFGQLASSERLQTEEGRDAFMQLFTEEERAYFQNATVVLTGIDEVCPACQHILFIAFRIKHLFLFPDVQGEGMLFRGDLLTSVRYENGALTVTLKEETELRDAQIR